MGFLETIPAFTSACAPLLGRVCSGEAAWLHKEKKEAFNFSPRVITPFSNTPGSSGANVQGRPEFDKLNSTVSPHLNLELGLRDGVGTLANQIRPEDKVGEYQIPRGANWCAPKRVSWIQVKTTKLSYLSGKDTTWRLPAKQRNCSAGCSCPQTDLFFLSPFHSFPFFLFPLFFSLSSFLCFLSFLSFFLSFFLRFLPSFLFHMVHFFRTGLSVSVPILSDKENPDPASSLTKWRCLPLIWRYYETGSNEKKKLVNIL